MEQHDKHIPTETVSIREWMVFSARAVPRRYKEENWGSKGSSVPESEEGNQLRVSLWRED
jgi:hypothetical protein